MADAGLLTNVGMLVANPAYDANRTNVAVLGRAAYHGTVVWSFQQGLMAGGLARQLALCGAGAAPRVDAVPPPRAPPAWCANATFVQAVKDAQDRLWAAIEGARAGAFILISRQRLLCSGAKRLFLAEVNTEVWSYSFDNTTSTFKVADLASLSPQGTESDAIQLWSYGFLGLIDPRTNRTIDS